MFRKTLFTLVAAAALISSCAPSRTVPQVKGKALEIPFQGNVFVTKAPGNFLKTASRTIQYHNGSIMDWSSSEIVLSLYVRTGKGPLHLYASACNPEGTDISYLTFSRDGKSFTVKVNSGTEAIYDAGTFDIAEPGYVKIDISGRAKKAGAQFARIRSFTLAGAAAEGECNCTTFEHVSDCYWYRRGPSVHLNYTLPEEDIEWFYNEATVPEGWDPPSTYYMLTGFREGYMGIQTHDGTPNSVLFSVWSPFRTDNPRDIPEDQKIRTLRKGEGVTAKDFGGEGSGGQSFMNYDWKPGLTYGTLVHVRPNGDGTTDYTGYFRDESGRWHLLASFRRPKTDTWYKGAHSFLECFQPETGIRSREVLFGNQWAVTRDGQWREITQARFTCDQTGRLGMRADMYGGERNGAFVLRNCGFFNEKTEYGTTFSRKATGKHPDIDFSSLP